MLWLALLGTLTLVPAVLWVARLTRRRTPRLTAAAVLLLVPGYLVLGWIAAPDLLLWAGARSGLDATSLAALYDHNHPTGTIAGVVFVVGHVVGTGLNAIGFAGAGWAVARLRDDDWALPATTGEHRLAPPGRRPLTRPARARPALSSTPSPPRPPTRP